MIKMNVPPEVEEEILEAELEKWRRTKKI